MKPTFALRLLLSATPANRPHSIPSIPSIPSAALAVLLFVAISHCAMGSAASSVATSSVKSGASSVDDKFSNLVNGEEVRWI